ncbi:MAG TPA: hypothetical protein VFQ65_10080 [Kofleriaceae bacterium]|nr:hypothetical protein [Kofleriaceae bacterium]
MLRWLAIAVLASCGHAPPAGPEPGTTHATPPAAPADAAPPPGLDDDLPKLAERSTALYEQLAKVLGPPAATDCAAVARELDKVASENADVLAANARVLHAGHEKIQRLKNAIEPHQDALDAAAKTISESQTMKTCAEDAAFAKAIDRLLGES